MKSRWIVGSGLYLQIASQAWKMARPEEEIKAHEIPQAKDFAFDFEIFSTIDPARDAVFVAFDERFGNFKRMELMQYAMERGCKLEPFISQRAMVGRDVVIGPNSFVGDGAIIGSNSKIDYNCVIGSGAIVGAAVHLKSSCWIESGVQIGDQVIIGSHSTVRMGTQVAPRVSIGRNCELAIPGLYREDVAPKTVFDPRYDEPIYVFSG